MSQKKIPILGSSNRNEPLQNLWGTFKTWSNIKQRPNFAHFWLIKHFSEGVKWQSGGSPKIRSLGWGKVKLTHAFWKHPPSIGFTHLKRHETNIIMNLLMWITRCMSGQFLQLLIKNEMDLTKGLGIISLLLLRSRCRISPIILMDIRCLPNTLGNFSECLSVLCKPKTLFAMWWTL
jgi:hypothetical protein